MPKLIFVKNNDITKGNLFKIAKDQSHIDNNADWNQEDYNIVDISQSDFDGVRLETKHVIFDGTNVTYEDNPQDEEPVIDDADEWTWKKDKKQKGKKTNA